MKPVVWITAVRGVFALFIGAMVLAEPERSRPMLVNFMGAFWLVAGLASLQAAVSVTRSRLRLVIGGVAGVVTGAFVIARYAFRGLLPDVAIVLLLAVVVLATGALHLRDGLQPDEYVPRTERWLRGGLGLLEAGLGIDLLIDPFDRGPALRALLCAWAWIAATSLLVEARRRMRAAAGAPKNVPAEEHRP